MKKIKISIICCLFFLFLVGTSSCKKGDDPKPEYIEIIVDGEKTYYETKDISTSDSFVHFTVTVMYPSSDIYLHIDGFKNDLLKTVPYGSKGMNLFGGKTKIDYKAKHNLSFTLLNYGSVGEFIDIKFNGTYQDLDGQLHKMDGTVHVIRDR